MVSDLWRDLATNRWRTFFLIFSNWGDGACFGFFSALGESLNPTEILRSVDRGGARLLERAGVGSAFVAGEVADLGFGEAGAAASVTMSSNCLVRSFFFSLVTNGQNRHARRPFNTYRYARY